MHVTGRSEHRYSLSTRLLPFSLNPISQGRHSTLQQSIAFFISSPRAQLQLHFHPSNFPFRRNHHRTTDPCTSRAPWLLLLLLLLLLLPPSGWTWPGSAPPRTGPKPFESSIPSFLIPTQFKTYGTCLPISLSFIILNASFALSFANCDARSCSDVRFQQPRLLLQQIRAPQARD